MTTNTDRIAAMLGMSRLEAIGFHRDVQSVLAPHIPSFFAVAEAVQRFVHDDPSRLPRPGDIAGLIRPASGSSSDSSETRRLAPETTELGSGPAERAARLLVRPAATPVVETPAADAAAARTRGRPAAPTAVTLGSGTAFVSSGADESLDKPIECPDMTPVFGAGGPVARVVGSSYRPRSGQIQMAEVIADALRERKHIVVEAGTGIGKTYAYLVPIIWSGTRSIVSTSNKALMSQLWHKDIPALSEIAPRRFSAALLKGRGNYLCALLLKPYLQKRQLPGFADDAELVARLWEDHPSGDVEEMGLPTRLREQLTVGHHICEGQSCTEYAHCLYERAKAEARAADIVVTNHALLCYNILRNENRILPVRPLVVLDEAHELEDWAINALAQVLEYGSLLPAINHAITRDAVDDDILRETMERNYGFFEAVGRQRPNGSAAPQSWELRGEIQEGIALGACLHKVWAEVQRYRTDEQSRRDALIEHIHELSDTVKHLAYEEPSDAIRFCQLKHDTRTRDYEAYVVQHSPLEVSAFLQRALFDGWPRVICTSATLGVGGCLDWYRRRVGLPSTGAGSHALSAIIPSPFDYPKNMLIYIPKGVTPKYNDSDLSYLTRLELEISTLVRASRGRAFLLFTSIRQMQAIYKRLSPVLDFPCVCQKQEMNPRQMLEWFQQTERGVLFGVRSFWAGVDIPGDALSLVVLDKIPFVPFADPVYRRREQMVSARGGDAFRELQIGPAVLVLRQGVGRLIRREEDRGVVALLDSRAVDAKYGPMIERSLPNGRVTRSIADVEAFFGAQ